MEQFKTFLENMMIEEQSDYRVGLTTYTFYRLNNNDFEVTHTRDGWYDANFSLNEVVGDSPMIFLNGLEWN